MNSWQALEAPFAKASESQFIGAESVADIADLATTLFSLKINAYNLFYLHLSSFLFSAILYAVTSMRFHLKYTVKILQVWQPWNKANWHWPLLQVMKAGQYVSRDNNDLTDFHKLAIWQGLIVRLGLYPWKNCFFVSKSASFKKKSLLCYVWRNHLTNFCTAIAQHNMASRLLLCFLHLWNCFKWLEAE